MLSMKIKYIFNRFLVEMEILMELEIFVFQHRMKAILA